ncbi:MAG: metallopeptidase family protein [Propionibacteriaceae bacterium]|jgi:predicted Zn-dependent protease with MMP-like domain
MPDRRDRHQRGMRGPLAPATSVAGRALRRHRPTSRAEFFVQCLSDSLARISAAAPEALVGVEVGLEDVPDMTGQWSSRVPLAAAQDATPTSSARIVVYRRPIEHRATTRRALRSLIHGTLVEQVSALTGIPAERLDPDDEDDED